jgi:hypothetical protein
MIKVEGAAHTMIIGEPWKTPIATRNVPAYRTEFVFAVSNMMYPQMPTTDPPTIKYPRFFSLSE